MSIVPVILAGGSGSRLWPLSRSAYPKQFLSLVGDRTLLQDTVLRARSIANAVAPLVICNQEHRFLVAEQLKQLGMDDISIILEPIGKNTAPAVAIAALYLKKQYANDPTLMILPADHVIPSSPELITAIAQAKANALVGQLVTFGITPIRPETGYGYIKTTDSLNENKAYKVAQFVEKPDLKTAQAYLASGQYYWNSGMFMFKASCFLEELELYAPDILQICQKAMNTITHDLDFIRLNQAIFTTCPAISMDYAIMEKTQNAVVVPLNTAWSDIGSWASLQNILQADQSGNVIQGDVITEQVTHSYLRAESRMLAVVGVTDHIIVETADAVLVAHKNNSQAVKDLIDRLKLQQRLETEVHQRVYRPWGCFKMIDRGDFFQVKHITVNPGAQLSLQMHHHRSEHWVVVQGAAEVTRGDEVFTIFANESAYIPQGMKHRLVNREEIPLEVIEVQTGSYLGEDDIVRFEDVYKR